MTPIHDTADLVSKALRRAWQLGQTYWQQADSEYQSHWKKADATQATFDQLVEDTRAAILTSNSGAQPAPSFADAYQGAMEEVAIWKKRALEAEDLNRKFVAEINGPTYMGEPAQPAPSVPDTYAAGINAVAAMLQSKADEYAKEHGHDDMGGLSFGPGMGGEIKMDYYTNLIELVDDVRAMLADAPSVPNDVVEQAVNRFLSWKLPKDFHPDGGMVFIPTKGRGYDSPHWPAGTNLLNAQQAREMLRYVLNAAPEAKP